jgi:hypothetical protein
MGEDLLHDAPHEVDRYRKTDALRAAVGAIQYRCIDADQIAVCVDERAARIAEVDGGIGLNEILKCHDAELAAPRGADDALSHRLTQSVGIADGQRDVADPQGVGAPQRHDRQVADGEVQDGDIGVGIAADEGRLRDSAVRQLRHDRVRSGNHVMVGHDGALGIDDDAGP